MHGSESISGHRNVENNTFTGADTRARHAIYPIRLYLFLDDVSSSVTSAMRLSATLLSLLTSSMYGIIGSP